MLYLYMYVLTMDSGASCSLLENHQPPIGQPLRSCRPTLAYTDTMAEHKGQSCFNSLPARQTASWRRCVTKLAGYHTSPAFTPLTPC